MHAVLPCDTSYASDIHAIAIQFACLSQY